MEIFREVLDLNLTSMMACCQKFKPLMTNVDTNIILLGSGASYKAVPGVIQPIQPLKEEF